MEELDSMQWWGWGRPKGKWRRGWAVPPEGRQSKAAKRDGSHGFPCPVLAISTQPKKGDAVKKIIWALAFAITTGIALTTAFGFNLLPVHLI